MTVPESSPPFGFTSTVGCDALVSSDVVDVAEDSGEGDELVEVSELFELPELSAPKLCPLPPMLITGTLEVDVSWQPVSVSRSIADIASIVGLDLFMMFLLLI